MDVFIKIFIAALLAIVCLAVIKNKSPDLGVAVAVAICILLFIMVSGQIGTLIQYCRQLIAQSGLDSSLFAPVLKVLCITIAMRVTSELCRDAGEKAIAAKVEIAGAAAGIICALPLLEKALGLIGTL